MRYLSDIKEGEHLVDHYLCKQKQTLKTRGGKSYYSLRLQDKTGTIDAKVWDLNDSIREFDELEYIKIDALVISYQNEYQLNVKKIRRSDEGEYDPADYIPMTDKNIDVMYETLISYINRIENKYIKQLMDSFFVEDDEFAKNFRFHTAAKNIHHSYMGGLLEHTVSVLEICDFLSERYTEVNKDLVYAGAILHDIGKVHELSRLPVNDYTDEGQLVGHIMIGYEMIYDKMKAIEGFPNNIANFIKHCVLSHHGELEYGSPKVPQIIEAMIIHCADNTDAKIKCIEETINNDQTEGDWTGYHRMLQRSLRKTRI